LYLLKHSPRLVFELARRFDARMGAKHHGYAQAPNELPNPADPDSVLYADWAVATIARVRPRKHAAGVAVEVQTHEDLQKLYSWLGYAAGVRRLFECLGWTRVFAPDPTVRRASQRMFTNEPRASPWFVEPEMLPPIVEPGRLAEARRLLLRVVEGRGLALDDAQREQIESCERPEQLERWLDRALTVTDAAALFE
jgi:hypothetical protein